MNEETLFPVGATQPSDSEAAAPPRVQVPVRNQIEMVGTDLESLLPADHQFRNV